MKPSISASIARILRRHFLVRPRRFRPAQSLERDYNLGPLDRLELAVCLELRFQVDFQDPEIAKFRTFGSLVALVRRRVQQLPAPAPLSQLGYELLAA